MNISNDTEANTLVYSCVILALLLAYFNDGILQCFCIVGIIISYTSLEIVYRTILGISLERDL